MTAGCQAGQQLQIGDCVQTFVTIQFKVLAWGVSFHQQAHLLMFTDLLHA